MTGKPRMRRILLMTTAFAALGAAGVSLLQAQQDGKAALPTGKTKEILQRIEGYERWQRFSEYDEPVKSEGHGGLWVVAWYNEAAAEVAKQGQGEFPAGSILVKENRPEPDADPVAITTMAKQNGGWYWIKSTPDGQVMVEDGEPVAGKVDSCIGCHSQAGRSMVFSGDTGDQ